MAENITRIKIGNDVHCLSLDTLVIDTAGLGFDTNGKLGVRLGSSMFAENSGIGVKIHPDTRNYLQPEPYGLSLKLDTMAEAMADAMAGAMRNNLGLAIDGYNNLVIGTGTAPLKLGTGLIGGDYGKTLCLSLGSGLEFSKDGTDRIRLKLDDSQGLIVVPSDGPITFNLSVLYSLLESRYNLTKK